MGDMQNRKLFTVVYLATAILLGAGTADWAKSPVKTVLPPINTSGQYQDFQEFIKEFQVKLRAKDVKFLTAHTAKDIKWSFGGENGKNGFLTHWQILEQPQNSSLWHELATVIHLGCTSSPGQDGKGPSHVCPYVYSEFPDNFDAYENLVITAKNVNIREKPLQTSTIRATVSYEIVKEKSPDDSCKRQNSVKTERCQNSCDWSLIELYSSKIQGYVCKRYLRSPIDYRAIFERINDRWLLTVFVSGD